MRQWWIELDVKYECDVLDSQPTENINLYTHVIEASAVEPLIEALEKIADPRKREHQEPDKYTEVGCMINIAEEALRKYREQEGI